MGRDRARETRMISRGGWGRIGRGKRASRVFAIRRRSRGPRETALDIAAASSLSLKGRGHRPDRDLATALHGATYTDARARTHTDTPCTYTRTRA